MVKTVKDSVKGSEEGKDNGAEDGRHGPKRKKPSASSAKLVKLEKKIAALKQANQEVKDRLLRSAAEFDNYRKRREAEYSQLISNANADLLLALLPVIDDLERSLGSVDESIDFDSFCEGIGLIAQNLKKVTEQFGLREIEAVGHPFDPEKHDALIQVESEEHAAGTVVDEHLKGYVLNERVLRHSQVLVSK